MKMFAIAIASLGALSLATAAFAAEGDFEKLDADADGQVTLQEAQAMHADWTAEAFQSLDADSNGALSKEEYEAATSG